MNDHRLPEKEPEQLGGEPINRARRRVLQAGGTGLAIAFVWTGAGKALAAMQSHPQAGDAAAALADGNPAFAPNAFIRIDTDGSVRLVMPNVEMGQGIYTAASMMLAEELDVGMDQIKVEHAPPNEALYMMPLLGGQITGGSTSVRGTWQVLREAGALGRTMLVSAAAAKWKVDPAGCTVAHGVITHAASGKTIGYGAIAQAAASQPVPAEIKLKEPKDFTIIGKPVSRVDSLGKVDGSLQYGIDVRVPGMKVGTVRACPTFGGKLVSVDDKAARAIPGVVDVLRIGNAVAVIGDHYWAAKKGLEALEIEWDLGANADLTHEKIRAALAEKSRSGPAIVGKQGGTQKADGTRIEAIYEMPMLAHATMEPLNTTVWVKPDQCEIWVGTQVPVRAVQAAAKITGLAEDKIVLHNFFIGGGFGRRLETDSIEQAVSFAKLVSYPIKLIWAREEDIRQDIVRPMYYDLISATVDKDGMPLFWNDRITSGTVLGRWAPGALKENGLDGDAVECAAETPYEFENLLVDWVRHDMPPGLLVGWWRGVGPTHNLFRVESFIDELAHAAKKDPLDYRRALLKKSPRALGVLNLAAEKIGWSSKPASTNTKNRIGRGIALGSPFGSHVCLILEVQVTPQGEVILSRAVMALDCGIAINPNQVEAQMQGGMIFGLSAALYNGITLKNGAIEQSNFHDYRSMRIHEVPIVEVHRIESGEMPGGLGEVGTAIAAPALGNAIFAATGVRLRNLPVDRKALVQDKSALKAVLSSAEPSANAETGAAS